MLVRVGSVCGFGGWTVIVKQKGLFKGRGTFFFYRWDILR